MAKNVGVMVGRVSEEQRIHLANWRNVEFPQCLEYIPEGLSAIEALGELKKHGYISELILIHGMPKTTSTPCLRAIGSSPSIKGNLPLFHEVLNEDKERVRNGPDIFIGKLIEEGIFHTKAGSTVVTKIMSHEVSEDSFRRILAVSDAVISTLREPARHIGCLEKEIIEQNTFNEDFTLDRPGIAKCAANYWQVFEHDIKIIEEFIQHDRLKAHTLIDGDAMAVNPEPILRKVCELISEQGFELNFSDSMINSWKPVFDPSNDPWARFAKDSRGFKAIGYMPNNVVELPPDYQKAHEVIFTLYQSLRCKYPLTSPPSTDQIIRQGITVPART